MDSREEYDPTALRRFRDRVRRQVERPAEITGSCDHSTGAPFSLLDRAVLRWHFGDVQMAMEGQFQESLYYLPDALHFMAEHEDGGEVTDDVVFFISNYAGELSERELLKECVEHLSGIFWSWVHLFRGRRIYRERPPYDLLVSPCVDRQERRDRFLDVTRETAVTAGGAPLFDVILSTWLSTEETAAWHSAHLLDFLLQVVLPGILPLAVYGDDKVRCAALDRRVSRRHWRICEDLVAAACPHEYGEAIRRVLL